MNEYTEAQTKDLRQQVIWSLEGKIEGFDATLPKMEQLITDLMWVAINFANDVK